MAWRCWADWNHSQLLALLPVAGEIELEASPWARAKALKLKMFQLQQRDQV